MELGTADDVSSADNVVDAVPVESPVRTAVLDAVPAQPLPLPHPTSNRAAMPAAATPSGPLMSKLLHVVRFSCLAFPLRPSTVAGQRDDYRVASYFDLKK